MYQYIAKHGFLLVERIRGERVGLHLRELSSNQSLQQTSLRELQRAKLRALLTVAGHRNEFYRSRVPAADAIANFESIPLLTKDALRENYRAIVTRGFEGRVAECKTSGSTGEPLKFYRDHVVFGYTLASVYRAHRWHGLDIGAREAMLWGIPAAPLARASARLRDLALNRFREREYDLSPEVLQHFFNKVARTRADYLFGYSSMVYEFALFVTERKLDGRSLGLKAAICTAETIHDDHRRLIEECFGCPVVSEYGSAETGIISYQCREGSHHVSDDCVLLELLDEQGKPVPDGDVGRVVVTVLHSACAPIIRYDLGDYAVRRPGLCPCGVTLSMLDRVIGRTSGIIATPSGKCFHSIALYYVMKEFADRFGGVRQFRVVQTHLDRLEFHVATDKDFSEAAQTWLGDAIRQRFGRDMRLEFFRHDRLERTAAGKLTDFESRLDPTQRLLASFGRPEFTTPAPH